MEYITHGDFLAAVERDSYYYGRWPYYSQAIDLIRRQKPESVLEIGPRTFPLCKGSDTIQEYNAATFTHDIKRAPWPIEDKAYDLAVALQVWEHLEDKQQDAFRELRRVSHAAVMSFPLCWDCPGDVHHHITLAHIRAWTLNEEPELQLVVSRPTPTKQRILYMFRFSEQQGSDNSEGT